MINEGPLKPTTPNYMDPRSLAGIFARGSNDYLGSMSPPGAGRPRNPTPVFQNMNNAPKQQQQAPQSPLAGAIRRRLDGQIRNVPGAS